MNNFSVRYICENKNQLIKPNVPANLGGNPNFRVNSSNPGAKNSSNVVHSRRNSTRRESDRKISMYVLNTYL